MFYLCSMAGHSKWAQIKRKKAVVDAKRGALFTRLVREITVAAREGGPNPDFNPRLRLAIQNARRANMPKDIIERAISKGDSGSESYTEVLYEGYAFGGVAVLIEAMTDNTNRTVSQLRTFSREVGEAWQPPALCRTSLPAKEFLRCRQKKSPMKSVF